MEILIPSTFGSDERDKRLQVEKVGRILRACAIFGISRITIYRDVDSKIDEKENSEFLEKNLKYGACPPYMRKEVFPLDEDLKYANIIPPLRIPSHGYPQTEKQKKYREAIVTEKRGNKAILNAGISKKIATQGLMKGDRVTIQLEGKNSCKTLEKDQIPNFWNINVENKRKDLGALLEMREDKTIIGTSRKGDSLNSHRDELKELNTEEVCIAFGSAWRGIYELAERDNFPIELFDIIINTVPGQNTKTVRTEEAILITLGVLNTLK